MRDATYFAIGPSFVLVLLVATGIGLALPGQPLLQAGAVVVAAVVGTEVELRWVPRPQRAALEAFHWVGLHDVAAFKAQTGSSVPAGVGGLKAWLVRHPETDATRPWRIEVLTAIGELTRARDELSRLVPGDGIDRMRRASLATEVDWVSGGPADVAGLATIAAEVGPEGSDERLFADGMVAWWESRIRLAALDPDWRTPLGAFRGRLGDAAAGLHVRTMRRRTIVLPLLFGLGFVLISLVGTGAADLVPARP